MSRGGPRGPRGGKKSAPRKTRATQPKVQPQPKDGKARTARDTRQELAIPTMGEVRGHYPEQVPTTITLAHPDRTKPNFTDRKVEESEAPQV
jgi:hypothetical protein